MLLPRFDGVFNQMIHGRICAGAIIGKRDLGENVEGLVANVEVGLGVPASVFNSQEKSGQSTRRGKGKILNDTPTLFKVPTTKRKPTGGFSGHERPHEGETNIWLTPKYIIDDLGPFDLDPCACETRWFDCARVNLTEREDGLATDWSKMGGVWFG